jgi:hypothetical protein
MHSSVMRSIIGTPSWSEIPKGSPWRDRYAKAQVLRYFASGDLKGFRVGLAKTAAVQIARSSVIEFRRKNQGRTITQAEIDQWLEK